MTARTYLDWNATAPLRPEARAAMLAAMDVVGNPSSVHAEGRAAKAVVERARGQVARAVGCQPREVVFTSGATEAASVLAHMDTDWDIIVDETAHDAVWAHRRKLGATHSLLALGLANSETGVMTAAPEKIDDKWRFGRAIHADRLFLDVTQKIGRIPFAFSWSGADMAILSAHKLGGPKGVGALIVREGLDIPALSVGGGQEMGRRSGTENVVGIAGFGAATEAATRDLEAGIWGKVEKLRNILESTIEAASNDTIFVGNDVARLPNTSCFATSGWKAETQVMQMDLAGFAISAGSACSSGKVKASRVLTAMGYDHRAASSAIRVSLGPTTTEDDVTRFAQAWLKAREKQLARVA